MQLKFPYNLSDVYESASRKRFTVISTFSGGGGSTIGYKLAGGDVLLANEFVEVAADTYKLNFPDTPVLIGDIKELTGKDFLDKTGLKVGELDILDGSPPCAAFSITGKKDKGWDKEKKYSTGKKVKNIEDLFYDFIRICNDIQPKIVIAENVVGLQQGESGKKLNKFIQGFDNIGYVVSFATINARDFGVAQNRPRTIIIAVRQDIFDASGNFFPNNFFPSSFNYTVPLSVALEGLVQTKEEIQDTIDILQEGATIRNVMESYPKINNIGKIMYIEHADSTLTNNGTKCYQTRKLSMDAPSNCLLATVLLGVLIHPLENRKLTTKESYRIMALPDDYRNSGTYVQQLERVGRMHAPFPLAHIANNIVGEYLGK